MSSKVASSGRSLVRSRFPRVAAGAAIDYSNSQLLEPRDIGSGFVGFTWDLDTDGRREAQIAQARIAAERNHLEIERQLRELEALVRSTQQAAAERLTALATAETAVGQAEENFRIRRQQFAYGTQDSERLAEVTDQALRLRRHQEVGERPAASDVDPRGVLGIQLEHVVDVVQSRVSLDYRHELELVAPRQIRRPIGDRVGPFLVGHLQRLGQVRDQPGEPGRRLEAVLEAYARIVRETRAHHDTELAAFLHQDEHLTRARRQLHNLIRDLLADRVQAGDLRDDVAPDELASYCLHALAAAGDLPSQAAVRRLVAVTLTGLRPQR